MKQQQKGQIEMMGLVVIVILVAIGLYIVISIVLSPKAAEVPVQENQLAQTFVNALVKTDTSCGVSITTLAQDCKLQQNINCTDINGMSISSCAYINETIGYIAANTLNVWGYSYNLSSPGLGMEYINKNCTGNKQRGTQGFAYISLYGMGDVLITLDICKR